MRFGGCRREFFSHGALSPWREKWGRNGGGMKALREMFLPLYCASPINSNFMMRPGMLGVLGTLGMLGMLGALCFAAALVARIPAAPSVPSTPRIPSRIARAAVKPLFVGDAQHINARRRSAVAAMPRAWRRGHCGRACGHASTHCSKLQGRTFSICGSCATASASAVSPKSAGNGRSRRQPVYWLPSDATRL